MKTAVYGTLLGLLNVKNHEVTSRLFDDLVVAAKQALANSEWQKVKYYVRYFGELVNANVILPAAYLDLLNDLLAALDESNIITVSILGYVGIGNVYFDPNVNSSPVICGLYGLYCACGASMGK
jgi:hypothetical protein